MFIQAMYSLFNILLCGGFDVFFVGAKALHHETIGGHPM